MAWTKATSGAWTHAGTDRDAVIALTAAPPSKSFRIQCTDTGDNVKILINASQDGRTGIECGIEGSDVVIRQIDYAVVGAALGTAAHGLSSAVPFFIEVRNVANKIEVFLNDSTTATITYDNTTSRIYAGYKNYGFVSDVNGAEVVSSELCELRPEFVEAAELLIAVCGGDVFASSDGVNIGLIGAGAFNGTGLVDLAEFEQKAYGVDAQYAKIIDGGTLDVENWEPTKGTLPGQTDPGTTSASIITAYRGRLGLNENDNRQNATFCAVNDPLNYDTDLYPDIAGSAFSFTAQNRAKIGQPMMAMISGAKGILVIGCTASVWQMDGDPVFGADAVDVDPLTIGSGVSGKDALILAEEGFVIAHSADGLLLTPVNAEAVNISMDVLTEGIQIPRGDVDLYVTQLNRDTRRHRLYIFLVLKTASGTAALSFIYDERVGKYQAGQGGFQPMNLPDAMGPTASCVWKGRALFGTRDGYIMEFDESTKNDDGAAIDCRFGYSIIDDPSLERDTILEKIFINTATGSDPVTYKVYRGNTPEEAFQRNSKDLMLQGTAPPVGKPIVTGCRAPALFLELSNNTVNQSIQVESVEVVTSRGRVLTNRDSLAVAEPGVICPHPDLSTTEPDPPGGGPGPGSGGGSSPELPPLDWMTVPIPNPVGGISGDPGPRPPGGAPDKDVPGGGTFGWDSGGAAQIAALISPETEDEP